MRREWETHKGIPILTKKYNILWRCHLWSRSAQVKEAQNRERAYLYAATITTGLVVSSNGGFWFIISSIALLLTAVLSYLSAHARTTLRPSLSLYYEEAINRLLGSKVLAAEHTCGGLCLKTLVAEKSGPKTPREKALIWSSIPLYGSAAILSISVILVPSLPILAEDIIFQWIFILGICALGGIGAPLLYRYFRGVTHVDAKQSEVESLRELKTEIELRNYIPLLTVLEYRNTLGELSNMKNGTILHNLLGLSLSTGILLFGYLSESWRIIFLSIPFTCFMINLVLYSEIEVRIWGKYQKRTEKFMENIFGAEVGITKLVDELGRKGVVTEIRSAISMFCLTSMFGAATFALFYIITLTPPIGVNAVFSIIFLIISILIPFVPLSRLQYFSKLELPAYVNVYN